MDLIVRLLGTVIAVFLYPGCASNSHGHRICRRGTERPCYQVSYIQDSRRRLTYEDARSACRAGGGELLSIETESEQRLVERFIQHLRVGEGDFWIGLRRNAPPPRSRHPGSSSPPCPSQYYWLDGSKAKFRRKTETHHHQGPSGAADPCVTQGPYAFSDVTKLHHPGPGCTTLEDLKKMYFYASAADNLQCDDYENLPCPKQELEPQRGPEPHRGPELGFVTNDIYEICRQQRVPGSRPPAGWVENEIYG
ncbi:hypothetical protein CRUP_028051 [Coryphaenoides rupestris]|nr:hypothetical protein CRUP_028051 [Coryphaenoides rupestris]